MDRTMSSNTIGCVQFHVRSIWWSLASIVSPALNRQGKVYHRWEADGLLPSLREPEAILDQPDDHIGLDPHCDRCRGLHLCAQDLLDGGKRVTRSRLLVARGRWMR